MYQQWFGNQAIYIKKSAAVLKYIAKFSSTAIANPLLEIMSRTCQDRYHRQFLPFFGNQLYCQFEEIMYSLNGGDFQFFRTEFVDLAPLKKFYKSLESTLKSKFKEEEPLCDRDPEGIFQNFCRITSVTHSEPRGLENLYRRRCCCQDPEKCSEQQRSSNLAFCRYDTEVFVVHKFEVKLNHSMRPYKYKRIVHIDSFPKEGSEKKGCFTAIVIQRDLEHRTRDSGVLTINSGQTCSIGKNSADAKLGFCGRLYNPKLEPLTTELRICCWAASKYEASPGKFVTELPAIVLNSQLFSQTGHLNTENRILAPQIQKLWGNCTYSAGNMNSDRPVCYFYFDQQSKQAINIREYENFRSFDHYTNQAFGFLLGTHVTSACVSIGGCALKDNKANCSNAEQSYFHCYCLQTLFCDYYLFLALQRDIYQVNIYVPFCNVGNISTTNPSMASWAPQSTTENFFCYERLFFIESADPNTKPQADIELGFFTLNMLGSQIQHKDCVSGNRKKRCLQLEDDSYFCCCLAPLNSPTVKPEGLQICNTGKEVQNFTDESMLISPIHLDNTLKDQRLCEENNFIMKDFGTQDMGLGLHMPAMCYFSMPIDKTGLHVDDINSYFVNLKHDKGYNHGIFVVLCKSSLWSPDEHIKGCKCRLLETPFEDSVSTKTTDILCCCVARMAQRNKEVMFRAKNPFKTGRSFAD